MKVCAEITGLALNTIEKAAERLEKLGLQKKHAVIVVAEMLGLDLDEKWFSNQAPHNTSRPHAVA